jgi:hypothetical protein
MVKQAEHNRILLDSRALNDWQEVHFTLFGGGFFPLIELAPVADAERLPEPAPPQLPGILDHRMSALILNSGIGK